MRKGKYQKQKTISGYVVMGVALVLFWLVIITTYMSAGLFAKYSTQNDGGDCARVMKFGTLTVSENDVPDSTGQEYIFTPGVPLEKKITVSFSGSEAAVFVFVELDAVGWTQKDTYDFVRMGSSGPVMSWSVDETAWAYLKSNDTKHIYYAVLKPNIPMDQVPVIKDNEITVTSILRADYTALTGAKLEINVTGYVVQANGFFISENMTENAGAAWDSLNP